VTPAEILTALANDDPRPALVELRNLILRMLAKNSLPAQLHDDLAQDVSFSVYRRSRRGPLDAASSDALAQSYIRRAAMNWIASHIRRKDPLKDALRDAPSRDAGASILETLVAPIQMSDSEQGVATELQRLLERVLERFVAKGAKKGLAEEWRRSWDELWRLCSGAATLEHLQAEHGIRGDAASRRSATNSQIHQPHARARKYFLAAAHELRAEGAISDEDLEQITDVLKALRRGGVSTQLGERLQGKGEQP
jgi:hypothetical protein